MGPYSRASIHGGARNAGVWCMLAAAALALPGASLRAADNTPGKIVYSRFERPAIPSGPSVGLHVINPDGSGDHLLSGATGKYNLFPTCSPDGKRLAWTSAPALDFASSTIVVANADGSDPRPLLLQNCGMPAWSPDSKRLAYVAGSVQPAVFVANADGSEPVQVSPQAGSGGLFPFWFPDGKSIGYTRLKKDAAKVEIVRVPVEGGEETVVTEAEPTPVAGANAFSPDGKRLLFIVFNPTASKSAGAHIWDDASKVESFAGDWEAGDSRNYFFWPAPAWSPDGKSFLAKVRTPNGIQLFKISEDGLTKERIPNADLCYSAVWIPGR